jgi:hypothetical protein
MLAPLPTHDHEHYIHHNGLNRYNTYADEHELHDRDRNCVDNHHSASTSGAYSWLPDRVDPCRHSERSCSVDPPAQAAKSLVSPRLTGVVSIMPGKPGRRAQRKANVTVTLPLEVLEKIDDLLQEGKVSSRSKLVQDAVEKYIKTL